MEIYLKDYNYGYMLLFFENGGNSSIFVWDVP